MLGQHRETFQVAIVEKLPGHTVAEENPADDTAARVKGHDRFGAEHVERAPHNVSLSLIWCSSKIGAGNEMRM